MRKAMQWAGGALALACLCGGPAPAQTPTGAAIAAAKRDSAASLQADQPLKAEETLIALTKTPEFAALDADQRSEIWALAAQAANRGGALARALAHSDRAVETHGPGPEVWRLRLTPASAFGDQPRIRDSLRGLATYYPETLPSFDDEALLRAALLVPAGAPTDLDHRGPLAEALVAHWKPRDPFITLDGLRLVAVEHSLAAGRRDEARRLASEISLRNSVILLRADRRYDGLTGPDGWRLPTPRDASEAALVRVRALRAQFPDRLSGVEAQATVLSDLAADQEALTLIDNTLAQLRQNPGDYKDAVRLTSWLVQRRSRLLKLLDRPEEAAKVMQMAADTLERGARMSAKP